MHEDNLPVAGATRSLFRGQPAGHMHRPQGLMAAGRACPAETGCHRTQVVCNVPWRVESQRYGRRHRPEGMADPAY